MKSILHFLTGRHAGALALGAVIVLALSLAATSVSAVRTERTLRARIAELTRINARQGAYWQAKLSACETLGPRAGDTRRVTEISAADRARRLAGRGPAGFDVCARMESADQAVLETLR
jgi:hypothetical protein